MTPRPCQPQHKDTRAGIKVWLGWKEGKGPRPFQQQSNGESDADEPRPPGLPGMRPRASAGAPTPSLTPRWGLCTHTEGISLSQKEQMSFVPNGNGFSAQTYYFHNTIVIVITYFPQEGLL